MVPTEPSAYPVSEIESLIAALLGVIAARVAMSDVGHIEEIHVLSDHQLHPKQIVRNIESALSAGLGLSVDRRIVSVAQVRPGDDDVDDDGPLAVAADTSDAAAGADITPSVPASADDPASSNPASPVDTGADGDEGATAADAASQSQPAATEAAFTDPVADPAPDAADVQQREPAQSRAPRIVSRDVAIASRYVFVGYDARTQPDLEAACRVTIRRGNEVISGNGTGPSTMLGRAQAAARAVFAAISAARRDHTLGLEGTTLVERHGRSYVIVAANATSGRESMPLTGAAAMHRSPEEAAILASLQATNRWAELDG